MEKNGAINFRIPTDSNWSSEDVEAKAIGYGVTKSVFAYEAVDVFMNFDEVIYNRINTFSEGLHVPKWLVMQNMLIKELAKRHASSVVNGKKSRMLEEFQVDGSEESCEMVTGKKLYDRLVERYVDEYKNTKALEGSKDTIAFDNLADKLRTVRLGLKELLDTDDSESIKSGIKQMYDSLTISCSNNEFDNEPFELLD